MRDWLDEYLEYTAPQEAPEIFHFWSGVAIIASVLNRRVYLPRIAPNGAQYYTNYPGQLSPILIAGSGKSKKSTAINIAKPFMKAAGVKVFDGKITPERLLTKLGQLKPTAVMTAVASELSAFLGKQSYNDGMIDILIKLADCESHPYETQKNQIIDLSDANICFTLFAGSTPIGLSKAIPPQAQEHGWLSRYIWVYSDKSGKTEPLANDEDTIDPIITKELADKKNHLIIRLRQMTQLSGRFRWASARPWFIQYYHDYAASPASEGEGWPTRRADHLVRLAMILHIAKGSTNLDFDELDLTRADHYISEIEKNMHKCFSHIGEHVNAEQQEKILKILREQKLTKSKDLFFRLIRYFPNSNELKTTLITMEEIGVIANMGQPGDGALYTIVKEPY